MNLSVTLSQNQVLSPNMELSVKILQMDSLQINEYLQQLSFENPVMEFTTPIQDDKNHLALRKMEWLESQAANQSKSTGYYEDSDENSIENLAIYTDSQSLTDYLFSQIALECMNEEVAAAARFLVGYINDNGYLTSSLTQIANDGHIEQTIVTEALLFIQHLEPLGLGASCLSECLCLQLGHGDILAKRLVTNNLADIAHNRYYSLAQRYQVDEIDIGQAVQRIRRLNPKPGSIFQQNTTPLYISPDVIVTNFEDHYNILLCNFHYPEIILNQNYLNMAAQSNDKEVLEYINTKIGQINWVKKCIENRNKTLLSVTHAIVKCQQQFFRHGPANLNVLNLNDVAEIVGLHESTISRAVKDKYLQCAHGIYPLKYFFVKGLPECSTSTPSIKLRLEELIKQENSLKPLSDQKLATMLEKEGIAISRRTVSKYREQLGIPKSSERIR